jgi:rhodanese-related sulfurtransferase
MSLSLPWAKLSTHQRLASIATVLGFLAIFAGSPYSGSLDRIARDAAEGTPQMAPLALAAAIRAQDGVIVIDARDSTAFADYHIPSATNIPLGMLAESRFSPRERMVVYAATDADATAAWLVLRAKGVRDVALLAGGLDGWLFEVMEPWLAAGASAGEGTTFEETAALARYFGGRARRGVDPASIAARNANPPTGQSSSRVETLRRVRRSCGVR